MVEGINHWEKCITAPIDVANDFRCFNNQTDENALAFCSVSCFLKTDNRWIVALLLKLNMN